MTGERKADHSVDITGLVCPMTFVKAKAELEELEPGQILEVIMKDGEPAQNVPRSMKEDGQQVLKLRKREDGNYSLYVRKIQE